MQHATEADLDQIANNLHNGNLAEAGRRILDDPSPARVVTALIARETAWGDYSDVDAQLERITRALNAAEHDA